MTDNIFADLVKIGDGDVTVLAARLQAFSDFVDESRERALLVKVPAQNPVGKLQRSVHWLMGILAINLVLTTVLCAAFYYR